MWARLVHIILGVWLMAAPDVLGYHDPARPYDCIVGLLCRERKQLTLAR
jgi:hypothetical protein